jgi:peptidoglycan-N-acetylglucosamine deacetylase
MVWNIFTEEKIIYLTFDDGPVEDVTPFVLDTLAKFDAKATFFCVGDNVRKNRKVFKKVIDAGHAIGNHTYHHLNAWSIPSYPYLYDIELCDEEISKHSSKVPLLFRPPYGKMWINQAKKIARDKKIIMWDVLTKDYDVKMSPEKCLENSIAMTKPGSIVVFHDSFKAFKRLRYTLPAYLEHFHQLGYQFHTLDCLLR